MNRLVLSARLQERGALRFTPAAVPALDMLLKHESELTEDERPRKVQLEIRALALGGITTSVLALDLGGSARFAGFLAAARNGRGVLFHVTALDARPADSATSAFH